MKGYMSSPQIILDNLFYYVDDNLVGRLSLPIDLNTIKGGMYEPDFKKIH